MVEYIEISYIDIERIYIYTHTNPGIILPQIGYRLHYILISRREIQPYISWTRLQRINPTGPIQLDFVMSCYIDFLYSLFLFSLTIRRMPHKLCLGAQFNNWVIANDTEEKLALLPHNFILRLCTLKRKSHTWV